LFERIPPPFSASPRCIPAPPPPSIRAFRALSPARKTSIGTVTTPIRVASIPAAHPYIHAITDPQLVRVLPDPPVPGAPAGQWWPPVAMTPEWLAAHARDYDVLHVHFGLESFSPAQVRAGLDAAVAVKGVHLVHAATADVDGGLVATGGRVLNVVALGSTCPEARGRAYEALSRIKREGGQYRTDIAARVS